MGFFKEDAGKSRRPSVVMPTVISTGTTVTGDLDGGADVQLDGVLKGNVRCTKLVVGASGALHGEALVKELVVLGEVSGKIKAHTVKIGGTARVLGDVEHEILEVEAGARVEGRYNRAGQSQQTDTNDEKAAISVDMKPSPMQREIPPTAPARKVNGAAKAGASALSTTEAAKNSAQSGDTATTH